MPPPQVWLEARYLAAEHEWLVRLERDGRAVQLNVDGRELFAVRQRDVPFVLAGIVRRLATGLASATGQSALDLLRGARVDAPVDIAADLVEAQALAIEAAPGEARPDPQRALEEFDRVLHSLRQGLATALSSSLASALSPFLGLESPNQQPDAPRITLATTRASRAIAFTDEE